MLRTGNHLHSNKVQTKIPDKDEEGKDLHPDYMFVTRPDKHKAKLKQIISNSHKLLN